VSSPLRLSFEVACSVEHAFTVWTSKINSWWPTDHTVSGEEDLLIVLQGEICGRIYERTADGTEHDWGKVTVWDPPTRLGYVWHLRRDQSQATDVEIRFHALGAESTRIDIEHRGWERLGADEDVRRQENRLGWEALLPHFVATIEKGHNSWPPEQSKTPGC
jgi:hypothetical protein